MNFAGLIDNDIVNSDSGVCVSLWFQGCDNKCKGCHNKHTWDHDGGSIIGNDKVVSMLEYSLLRNGIKRNLSILGGEPLSTKNRSDCNYIISKIRKIFGKSIKIYLWTGFVWEDLLKEDDNDLTNIFKNIDKLIDGPYIEEQRVSNVLFIGSSNQRIIELSNL